MKYLSLTAKFCSSSDAAAVPVDDARMKRYLFFLTRRMAPDRLEGNLASSWIIVSESTLLMRLRTKLESARKSPFSGLVRVVPDTKVVPTPKTVNPFVEPALSVVAVPAGVTGRGIHPLAGKVQRTG